MEEAAHTCHAMAGAAMAGADTAHPAETTAGGAATAVAEAITRANPIVGEAIMAVAAAAAAGAASLRQRQQRQRRPRQRWRESLRPGASAPP